MKAGTSPWPNPIKCFEGWRVQSVSAGYRSPLELSSKLSQTKKRDILCEEIQEEVWQFMTTFYVHCIHKKYATSSFWHFSFMKKGFVKLFRQTYIKHRHDLLNDLASGPTLGLCLFSALFFQLFRWKHGVMASPVSSNLTRNPLTSTKDCVVELVYHQYNTTHYSIIIWANAVQHATYKKWLRRLDMRFKWSVITVHPAD